MKDLRHIEWFGKDVCLAGKALQEVEVDMAMQTPKDVSAGERFSYPCWKNGLNTLPRVFQEVLQEVVSLHAPV